MSVNRVGFLRYSCIGLTDARKLHAPIQTVRKAEGLETTDYRTVRLRPAVRPKAAITSKIKHAMKHTINHKTSPAKLAQLLQLSLAFCFSLQPMTSWSVRRHWLRAETKC